MLEWPSQLPDVNSIQNIWTIIKLKLRGNKTWTVKQLVRQIIFIWKSLSKDYAKKLVESMTCRLQLINNEGDWIAY